MTRTILNTKKVKITAEKKKFSTQVRIFFNGEYVLSIDTNDAFDSIEPDGTVFKGLRYKDVEGYVTLAGTLEVVKND